MKGPSEKGDLFAVLEYMKGGQVVTHPCAPLSKIELSIRSPSPSPEPEVHSYHAFFKCMSVVVCVVLKPRPCNSYSRRRDRINSVLWRSYYKGGGGGSGLLSSPQGNPVWR